MNEWMCIYIPHISHHVSWRFAILLSEIVRQLLKAPLPLSVHIWSHSPTQPMREMWDETRDRPQHRELHTLLFSFDKCVGSLTSPANYATLKTQKTGPTAYSLYPRRLEWLTIWRYNYKGNTFSSVILKPRVLVRSGARTFDLPHSRLVLYQLS